MSFDHATPIDPLVVERIELLRGPAALRYGGSAAGGVVNSVDNRIPKRPVHGVGGAVEARLGAGGDDERGGAALVEAGDGRRALHVDAFARETSDLRVPRHAPAYRGMALPETTRVRNSDSRTYGGALGGALTFDRGHLGAAVESYDSRYGTVADPLVQIRMQRDRYSLGGEAARAGRAGERRARTAQPQRLPAPRVRAPKASAPCSTRSGTDGAAGAGPRAARRAARHARRAGRGQRLLGARRRGAACPRRARAGRRCSRSRS